MKVIKTKSLTSSQKKHIFNLWNNEYPQNLKYNSINEFESYLNQLNNLNHYLFTINDEIMGWAFTFERESEKWFALIISEIVHGKRYGTNFLNQLKEDNLVLNGWVIDNNNQLKSNGNLYKSPLDFYIKNEFSIIHNIRLETDKLSAVKIIWNN